MSTIIVFITTLALIFSIICDNLESLNQSIMTGAADAVKLSIELLGMMALWGGLMNIVKKSGLDKKINFFLKPLCRLLFSELESTEKAFKAVSMNITANLLGLGNAATPLGIQAMKELKEHDKVKNSPSKNMAVFTVLNTASIQLIPTTIAAMRLSHGAENPMDIIPAVLITSLCSVSFGIIFIKVFWKKENRN